MGEESMVFEQQPVFQEPQSVIPQANYEGQSAEEPTEESVEESVEETTEEPVEELAEQTEEQIEEDNFDSELERTFQEVEDEMVEEEVKTLPTAKPIVRQQIPEVTMPKPVTQSLFDIKLDPTVMAIIQQRIAMTPHVGFRPVVNVQKNGNINLTFEKI